MFYLGRLAMPSEDVSDWNAPRSFSAQGMWWDSARRKVVEMYTDEEVKKCSVDSINAYIEQGKSFGLETTALPNDMYVTISKWNDDVVCFLRNLYGRSPVCYRRGSTFETELRRPANAGERFAMLIGHLESLLEEIKNGNECFFKRWSRGEAIWLAGLQ